MNDTPGAAQARHAVVTGGGSGIGLAIAQHLHRQGSVVTIMGRGEARLKAAADASGFGYAVCDVTDDASTAQAFAQAVDAHGPIDVLVNNAGGVKTAPFGKLSLDDWQSALNLNLLGTIRCINAVLPAMRERGWGRVVNIGSTAGLKGYAYVTAYTAAKHGVVGLTRALALELATTGVTINAICPGYADTDIIRDAVTTIAEKTGRSEDEALKTFTKTNPQGRLVQPAEVAAATAWLASDAAAAVTGIALPIAGGEV
jgi:NAD(P)-dependent dehydrogenase (short-subunit alcohol dehydrogenase family)